MIRILDSHIAQKIAAGEVIERPAAVVRELIDNAIDSGARHIRLAITDGGMKSISLTDDGMGMSEADLAICWKSHATSKIRSFEDLYGLNTLGFRGEALYAIAAAARLSISSCPIGESQGHQLKVVAGELLELTPHAHAPGTTVLVEDLFFSMPARKEFLKRNSTEAKYCRDAFREKALSHPHISWEYYVDGTLMEHYEASSLCERVVDIYKLSPPSAFSEHKVEKSHFAIQAVLGDPSVAIKNRSHIKIYIGGRPIVDYGLQTAVLQGYDRYIPGGLYPEAFIFIDSDPALVDVNIHPAKREVRLKHASDVHRGIYYMIKDFLGNLGVHELIDRIAQSDIAKQDATQQELIGFDDNGTRPTTPTLTQIAQTARTSDSKSDDTQQNTLAATAGIAYTERETVEESAPHYSDTSELIRQASATSDAARLTSNAARTGADTHMTDAQQASPANADALREMHYKGQLFDCFLIAEIETSCYLVDQHAAHERIRFNRFSQHMESQAYLIPLRFFAEQDQEAYLLEHQADFMEEGIEVVQKQRGIWEITAAPAFTLGEEKALIAYLLQEHGGKEEYE